MHDSGGGGRGRRGILAPEGGPYDRTGGQKAPESVLVVGAHARVLLAVLAAVLEAAVLSHSLKEVMLEMMRVVKLCLFFWRSDVNLARLIT